MQNIQPSTLQYMMILYVKKGGYTTQLHESWACLISCNANGSVSTYCLKACRNCTIIAWNKCLSGSPTRFPVKSAPSRNGLKMKVKSATYFKLNKKLCITGNMNSYFLLKECTKWCLYAYGRRRRRFIYNFIFLDEQVLFLWMKLITVIKWLVIYIKRDWRQLYNYSVSLYW